MINEADLWRAMESYIVRIYRREESKPGNLLGTVETMGSTEKLAFTNRDELWSILDSGDDCAKKSDARETGKSHGKDGGRGRKR